MENPTIFKDLLNNQDRNSYSQYTLNTQHCPCHFPMSHSLQPYPITLNIHKLTCLQELHQASNQELTELQATASRSSASYKPLHPGAPSSYHHQQPYLELLQAIHNCTVLM